VVRIGALLLLVFCLSPTLAGDSPTVERKITLAKLFPENDLAALTKTLPADREVTFRVREPRGRAPADVLIFISANDSGELPEAWIPVVDERRLLWIAADGYGNSRLTAERVVVALMAGKLAERLRPTDAPRIWVAGFSGGGRVASRCVISFARYFDGALFMGGADFVKPARPSAELMESRRMVFLTGSEDFNRREMKSVAGRYGKAGVKQLLLLDEPGFGHELATREQLSRAIEFLEAR
jgi:pimeloyl-ACP methyl ester carboxylesterase